MLATGKSTKIPAVKSAGATALHSPQTGSGDIVVDGVLALTYATAVQPRPAHALLAPVTEQWAIRGTFVETPGWRRGL